MNARKLVKDLIDEKLFELIEDGFDKISTLASAEHRDNTSHLELIHELELKVKELNELIIIHDIPLDEFIHDVLSPDGYVFVKTAIRNG